MQSDRALYTPEMDHAERELEARAEYALSVGRKVAEQTEKFKEKLGPPQPPTDEDVERIRKFVLGHAMTEQWRAVVERINRGELTWRGIVEGLVYGTLDSGVSAAFRSLTRVPPVTKEELIASGVFEAEPAAEEPEPEADKPAATGGDEDEWFDEDPLGRVTS